LRLKISQLLAKQDRASTGIGTTLRLALCPFEFVLRATSHLGVVAMFRKFFAVLMALTMVVGGLFADDISGVFKKFEDGKVTIEADGKEKTYKVNAEAKIKAGQKELLLTDAFKNWKADQKGTFTVEKEEVVGAKKVK
jgi:hypothetical protein